MKVFVTGATGFIGRFLIQRLINEGKDVIALVRNQKHNLPKVVEAVYGDILFPDSLGNSGYGCHRLYHLAGMISFDPRKRKQLLLVNGTGTSNILSASLRWDIETTVVVSSACTMGLSSRSEDLLNEESLSDRITISSNPYLESKLAAEKTALIFSAHQRVVIVNPTTVYGPGDWTLNSGTLVKKIATSCILPVPSGGSNVVDIEDVVEGIILAGEKGKSGFRYIIGGQNLTFKEIFSVISDVVGNKPFFVPIPSLMRFPLSFTAGLIGRFTDSRFLTPQLINDMFSFKYYSTKLAESQLGFKAHYCFRESIERGWAFYQGNGLIS